MIGPLSGNVLHARAGRNASNGTGTGVNHDDAVDRTMGGRRARGVGHRGRRVSPMTRFMPRRESANVPLPGVERWAMLSARIALGAAFLSGVAARFGLWGTQSRWRNF